MQLACSGCSLVPNLTVYILLRESLMMRTLFCFLLLLSPFIAHGQSERSDDVPALPKVILVGDSIRMSYAPIVAKELAGKATVISSKSNGGDSSNVLRNLTTWVVNEKPAIVHFNCGIHDTKKFKATGKFQISPEQYESNLRQIVTRIRKETPAIVLFGTTTPILDDRAAVIRRTRDYELLNASVEQYNEIARKVMHELKVPVNNLNAATSRPKAPQTIETLIGNDGVHLTPAGRDLLGKQVSTLIVRHLGKQPK